VLVWRLRSGAGLDLSLRPEWLSVVSRGMLGNIYYLINAFPLVILCTLNGLGAVALLVVLRQRYPSPWHDRSLIHFSAAAGLIMGVQIIAVLWLPATFVIQLQLSRIGLYFTIFSLPLFCNFRAYSSKKAENTPSRSAGAGRRLCCSAIFYFWLVGVGGLWTGAALVLAVGCQPGGDGAADGDFGCHDAGSAVLGTGNIYQGS
jgi:hypothetical protein